MIACIGVHGYLIGVDFGHLRPAEHEQLSCSPSRLPIIEVITVVVIFHLEGGIYCRAYMYWVFKDQDDCTMELAEG